MDRSLPRSASAAATSRAASPEVTERSAFFRIGDRLVEIRSASEGVHSLATRLYRQAIECPAPADLILTVTESGDELWLECEGVRLPARSEQGLMHTLIRRINRLTLDEQSELTHFHAGAVCRLGGAVMLVAGAGTGKSTTAACAQLAGFRYITDEMVGAGSDGRIGAPLKPISMRPPGLKVLSDYAGELGIADAPEPDALHIAPDQLGAAAPVGDRHEVSVIAFLTRDGGHAGSKPLSAADATVALIDQSMDFGRGAPESLRRAGLLCASASCHVVEVGDPASTIALLDDLLDSCEQLDSEAAVKPLLRHDDARNWSIAAGVDAINVGTGVVFANRSNGETCSVNGDLRSADVSLVATLAGAGFVELGSRKHDKPKEQT